jgi:hypothetical protein
VLIVAEYGLHPTNIIIMSPCAALAGKAGVNDVLPESHAPAVMTDIPTPYSFR